VCSDGLWDHMGVVAFGPSLWDYVVPQTQSVGVGAFDTARSREDGTRNGHQNAKRNPRWSSTSQVSTFSIDGHRRKFSIDGHLRSLR